MTFIYLQNPRTVHKTNNLLRGSIKICSKQLIHYSELARFHIYKLNQIASAHRLERE